MYVPFVMYTCVIYFVWSLLYQCSNNLYKWCLGAIPTNAFFETKLFCVEMHQTTNMKLFAKCLWAGK